MGINHFNIRVYGILINEENQLLVTDELINGHKITKLPGGGLEFGEGTIDCIKREFIEETKNEIEVIEHFYTTDFFQKSAYNNTHQIMSIYYKVKPSSNFKIISTEKIFDFGDELNYIQTFRWVDIPKINENTFTLPIDKVIANMIISKI